MKRMAMAFAAILGAVGCGSAPPKNQATTDDLKALEDRQNKTVSDMETRINQKIKEDILDLQKQYADVTRNYTEMLATHQEMKNTLADLKKVKSDLDATVAGIDQKVVTANKSLIAVLEAEQKLLQDRLAEIGRTLEELKK